MERLVATSLWHSSRLGWQEGELAVGLFCECLLISLSHTHTELEPGRSTASLLAERAQCCLLLISISN